MKWKKRKWFGKNKDYSVLNKLKKENKINKNFELVLNNLSLEEIIALKLEVASKGFGSKMYGIPLWRSMPYIINDALLKYALSACRSKKEAARFLGITKQELSKAVKKYDIESYFEENN